MNSQIGAHHRSPKPETRRSPASSGPARSPRASSARRARVVFIRLLLLAIASAPAGRAAAQQPPSRPPGQIRFGPLSLTPGIGLTDLGVDTNVFNTQDNRKADFTFTLVPQVDALVDLRRIRVQSVVGLDVVYYQTFKSERSINRDAQARVEIQPSRRLMLFGSASVLNTRTRLSVELDARARREAKSVTTGFELRIGRKLTVGLAGSSTETTFNENAVFLGQSLQETLNQRSRGVSAEIRYERTPLTTIILDGSAYRDRFPFFPAKDTDGTRFTLAGTFRPRALVSGVASVGVQRFVVLSGEAPDFQGVVAQVELAYRPRESTELGVVVGRSTGYSFEAERPYYVSTIVGGSIRQHLFRSVNLLLRADRQNLDYRRFAFADPPPPTASDRDVADHYSSILEVRAFKRARLGLNADYTRRISGRSSLRSYDGLRLSATVSYGAFNIGNRQDLGGFSR